VNQTDTFDHLHGDGSAGPPAPLEPAAAPASPERAAPLVGPTFLANAALAITIRNGRTRRGTRADEKPEAAGGSLACALRAQH
jgi:hypothetical protein